MTDKESISSSGYYGDIQLDQQRESDQADVADFSQCNVNRIIFEAA